MKKYFSELDKNNNIIGVCSLTFKKNEEVKELINNYNMEDIKVTEITEKEYDNLRKFL